MVIGWFNELLSCYCNYPYKDDNNGDEKTKIKKCLNPKGKRT